MRLIIDEHNKTLATEPDGQHQQVLPLYSREAFELISDLWLKIGWNEKYAYTFTWLGRPIIQLPEDMIRIQEVIYQVRPDVIIETGVAHGGSLIFYASLCKLLGKGRVIGVDIEIRSHNRKEIELHELASFIALIEGDSKDPTVVEKVRCLVRPGEAVLVILDSLHAKEHVLQELAAYSDLVTTGSYIIATDGIMKDLADVPRGKPDWKSDNPARAAQEFASLNANFLLEEPPWLFNEGGLTKSVTHWPEAYLKRIR